MEFTYPFPFIIFMELLRKRYRNNSKLEMLPGHSAFNHLPTFPDNMTGKYVQMNRLSILSEDIVHSLVSMYSSGSVMSSYLGMFGIITECDIPYAWMDIAACEMYGSYWELNCMLCCSYELVSDCWSMFKIES